MTTPANIKQAVLAALQPAEEMEGPDGLDYIRLMGELAVICASRAQECAKHMDTACVAPPPVDLTFHWVVLVKRTTTYHQERSVGVRAETRAEAAKYAKERALSPEFWANTIDSGHSYNTVVVDIGVPLP